VGRVRLRLNSQRETVLHRPVNAEMLVMMLEKHGITATQGRSSVRGEICVAIRATQFPSPVGGMALR
jgi:hypothetical protein